MKPHPFVLDPDTPGDPWAELGVCATCRLLGKAGDAHHDVPDAHDEQAEHRKRVGDE